MKKLEPIKIEAHGVTHTVDIQAHRKEGGILFVATCGGICRESQMNMHTDSVSSKEQYDINVREHVDKLAKETAGHLHNQTLLDGFFAEEKT